MRSTRPRQEALPGTEPGWEAYLAARAALDAALQASREGDGN